MIVIRTDATHPDLEKLIPLLDKELKEEDGPDHAFFAQYNKLHDIRHVVIAYMDRIPVGCGALKIYEGTTGEVKRMFVHPDFRRRGIAEKILAELETWAQELGFEELILETGKTKNAAPSLYTKHGYSIIPNYGQYTGVEQSLCMRKRVK